MGVVLAMAAMMLACGDSSVQPERPTTSVSDERGLAPAPVPDPEARYVAVLVPLEAVDLSCKESGDLTAVHVHPGDLVTAGDVVAEVDLGPIAEALTIARAELRSTKAMLEQREVDIAAASRALEIETDMLKKGIGTQKHVEEARFALERARKLKDAADAAVAEQQARIAQLQRRARESAIKAPFSGAVALRYRDPGTAVSAGTALIRLIRVDALWARFAVPPTDIIHLDIGDSVRVEVEHIGVSLLATVKHISPELDPAAQMVFVDAWLQVPESLQGSLRAGLPGWVRPVAPAAHVKPSDSRSENPPAKAATDVPDATAGSARARRAP